jgi:sulfite reductase alpha subunit-like flavoprotein
MAKEVMKTITEILQTHSGMNAKQAMEFVASLMKSGKYVADIW